MTEGTRPSLSELRSEEAEAQIRYCEAIVVPGRLYLSNGDPGYPDEYCDNEAEPDSEYCEEHQAPEYEDGDLDPDLLHDQWNEARDGSGE